MDTTAHALIQGALVAWGTRHRVACLQAGDGQQTVAICDDSGQRLALVRRQVSPLGWVWAVQLGDRRERVLPSVVTALRYLRSHLCPEREAGRVLFGHREGV